MTEQDVERLINTATRRMREAMPTLESAPVTLSDGTLVILARAALSAMPNKHKKAVKVLREALEKISNDDSRRWYTFDEVMDIAKQALATIDEIVKEGE